MYLGKLKTDSNIAWHRPQSTTCREEEELMQKSVRALANTTDPVEKLRLLCLSRGAAGIMRLGRVFRKITDDSGSKQLNREQFADGIRETGVALSDEDAEEVFNTLDTYNSGSINVDEFISQIRPPMVESRCRIVEQAFKKLDKGEHGVITIDDMRKVYSMTAFPRYMSGEESGDLIMGNFLAHFESINKEGVVDDKVTMEDFMNYYSGISVSMDDDCYFDLTIRKAYKL